VGPPLPLSTPGIEKSALESGGEDGGVGDGLGGGGVGVGSGGGVVVPALLSVGAVSVPTSCAKATSRGERINVKQRMRAKSFRSASIFLCQRNLPRPIL
jgi:hypothetical protein